MVFLYGVFIIHSFLKQKIKKKKKEKEKKKSKNKINDNIKPDPNSIRCHSQYEQASTKIKKKKEKEKKEPFIGNIVKGVKDAWAAHHVVLVSFGRKASWCNGTTRYFMKLQWWF